MGKTDKVLEMLRRGVRDKDKIMKEARCSPSTVNRAMKMLGIEARKPKEPAVTVIEEPVPFEEIPPMAPLTEEGEEEEEEEEEGEAPLPLEELPPEITKEEFGELLDACLSTDTLGPEPPEGYGYSKRKIKVLRNLWYLVVRKYWKEFVEKHGVEAMAVIGTVLISLPQLRKLWEEMKALGKVEEGRRRKRREEEEEEEGYETEESF